jgi:hypothetical protein
MGWVLNLGIFHTEAVPAPPLAEGFSIFFQLRRTWNQWRKSPATLSPKQGLDGDFECQPWNPG